VRDRLQQIARETPGVEAVSWTWYLPYQVSYAEPRIHAEGSSGPSVQVIEQGIGPNYLATLELPLVDGREFRRTDLTSPDVAPAPVIVNEELARRLFPNRRAVGQRLLRGEPGASARSMVVIGVSRDTAFRLAGEGPPPLLQSLNPYTPSLVVRTNGPALSAIAGISRTLERAAPGAVAGSFAVSDRARNATFLARAAAAILSLLAGTALVVAAIGLCALVLCNVARRRREAAIRMALGATKSHISSLMVVEHMKLVAWGCLLGTAATIAVSPHLAQFLADGVEAATPMVFVCAVGAVLSGSGGLSWLASRKLSRIEPSTALRSE
jgi:hypothetical protein